MFFKPGRKRQWTTRNRNIAIVVTESYKENGGRRGNRTDSKGNKALLYAILIISRLHFRISSSIPHATNLTAPGVFLYICFSLVCIALNPPFNHPRYDTDTDTHSLIYIFLVYSCRSSFSLLFFKSY